jgi:hypothetical protein
MRKGLIEPSLLVSTHGNIEINNGRARCGTGSLPGLLVSSATVFLQRISKGKLPRHPLAFNRFKPANTNFHFDTGAASRELRRRLPLGWVVGLTQRRGLPPGTQALALRATIRGFHPDRWNASVSCASRSAAARAAADC